MHCSEYSKVSLNFAAGVPPHDFFGKAWLRGSLTKFLPKTNLSFAFPEPDEDISLIAKQGQEVVGRCSANRVLKYWDHMGKIDSTGQNRSTQIFVRIHKKAVEAEKEYLEQINEPREKSFYSADLAVLPNYAGIGLLMRAKQIERCKELEATTLLFCETAECFGAATAEHFGFTKIAEYPYSRLADEPNCEGLKKIDDSFSVWCLKV